MKFEFGEGQHIEFKKSVSDINKIIETVVAFANNGGGKIYIGVKDNGIISGVTIGKNTIERLIENITKKTEAPILPEVYIKKQENYSMILLQVAESRNKPHFYKKIAYKRVGKTNIKLSINELKTMIISDYAPFFDATLYPYVENEIDWKLFEGFVKLCKSSGRININLLESRRNILKKLDVLKEKKIKLGFLLCFAKNPAKYLSYYNARIAIVTSKRFTIKGIKKTFLYDDPIFKVVEDIVFEIVKELPKKTFLDGIKRIEKPIIPELVIREFLLNAFIHRDYRIASGINILLTPTYLEISNPGKLNGLNINELYKHHRSVLCNPLIAKLLYYAGYIEQWGSGIETSIKTLLAEDLGLPIFKEEGAFFSVRIQFTNKDIFSKYLSVLKKGSKSNLDIAKYLKVSERTSRNQLLFLINLGIIKKERKGRRILYSIIQ